MKNQTYKGHVAMFTANVMWGLNAPFSKELMGMGITPLTLTTCRIVGGAFCFWIASIFVKQEHVNHKDLLKLFFASLFCIVLNQSTFLTGLSLTSPIDATVVTTTLPIITMIVAAFYLKEPVTGKKVLGIFIGAIGALTLILSNKGNADGGNRNIWGDVLCLLAQFSFAVYLTVFMSLMKKYSPITIMKWMFVYASICFIPFSYNDLVSVPYEQFSWPVYWRLGFVVLIATFFSYILIMIGQKNLRPTVVSIYNYIQPIVASIVVVVVGMDTFGPVKAVAVVLVFLGVYVVNQSRSREQMEAYEKLKEEKNKFTGNEK